MGIEDYSGVGFDQGLFLKIYFIMMLFLLIAVVFLLICQWKIFKKNNKPGWYSLIPFLNTWTWFEISGFKGWLSLIPFANIVCLLISNYTLPKKMGKSTAIAILTFLLPGIGYIILAFSKDSVDSSTSSNIVSNNEVNNLEKFNDSMPVMESVNNVENNSITEEINNENNMSASNENKILEENKDQFLFCPDCGSKVEPGSLFCYECGRKF